ncbi:MAG: diacylglycerol kinase family protein [Lachnospiraceae bacterium]|nr:diacylglycerol kinase family protein [Lachnospiraceae bacterium]
MKNVILYNPYSNNKRGQESAKEVEAFVTGETVFEDITKIKDILGYINNADAEDKLILVGGDGTINHLANDLKGTVPDKEILLFAAGTGNDFKADIAPAENEHFISLNKYLSDLPTVTINGKTTYFLNGIGYGIDGYCCEVGDKLRAASDKPVNYAGIAIKGLLFHFKPRNATIIVDGEEKTYKHVWLAPTMKGRFYGGGMMVAPEQNRLDQSREVSTVVMYGSGKFKTLMVFPSIFKGEHVSHKEMVEVRKGHNITVKFDTPCALQIDGETVLNVSEYTVQAK